MPSLRLIPIIPKRPVSRASRAKVSTKMRKLGLDIVKAAAVYPTQQSTDYVRTGSLGKKWTMKGPSMQGSDMVVEVGNVMDYTGFVMGFKSGDRAQLDKFRDLGWRSIEEIGEEEIERARPGLQAVLQE
ncbi:hypothetical protein LCGC14_2974660, partial [marine sediment metagenome]